MINLYLFSEEKMQLSKEKIDQLLKPINEEIGKKTQRNIESYFTKESGVEEISSERMKKAIKILKRKKSDDKEKNKKSKK
jgi:hypothetical protein